MVVSWTHAPQIVAHIPLLVSRLYQSSSPPHPIPASNSTFGRKVFSNLILQFILKHCNASSLALKQSGRILAAKPPFGGSLTHHTTCVIRPPPSYILKTEVLEVQILDFPQNFRLITRNPFSLHCVETELPTFCYTLFRQFFLGLKSRFHHFLFHF